MKFKGVCNRCGNCCFIGEFKCANLILSGKQGEPMAAHCLVYHERIPGMPIILTKPNGEWRTGICAHTLPAEDDKLLQLIIDGKCSLGVTNG